MTTYIIGADVPQAREKARELGLNPHDGRAVQLLDSERSLEGRRIFPEDDLVFAGQWWRHPNLRPLIRTLHKNAVLARGGGGGGDHQIFRETSALVQDWAEADRVRAEVEKQQARQHAVADAETQRLHELHLRRGGTR